MPTTSPARTGRGGFLSARIVMLRRWLERPDRGEVVSLGAVALVCALLVIVWPSTWPIGLMMLPLVIGSLVLSPRTLSWFVVCCMVLTTMAAVRQTTFYITTVLGLLVVFGLGLVVLMLSFRRMRLGVGGVRGESMFVDLRDRLLRQHQLPALPDGWSMDFTLRTAEGTPYAGDFTLGLREGDEVQVALVDVSGKGTVAGTRALFLSGAMNGLMGALPGSRFLPASNDYLCRQDWDEGFASAVQLTIDLSTGDFAVRSAGHPPALHLHSGSGTWEVCDDDGGPVLGLIEDVEFPAHHGRLHRGDVIMIYTDGLIERSGRSLDEGINRLLGQAERELVGGRPGGAERLVRLLGSKNDDCALLIIHRH